MCSNTLLQSPRRVPDFIIVGAMKSATTSLWSVLRKHPQIFMPALKEPHFFSSPEYLDSINLYHRNRLKSQIPQDLESYSSLFSPAQPQQLCGEASASYFLMPQISIPRILGHVGDIKIIVVLRNPYERSWSEFQALHKHSIVQHPEKVFLTALKNAQTHSDQTLPQWIDQSLYYARVVAFKENFSSVHVLLLDDLQRSPENFFSSLYNFLNITPQLSSNEILHYNRGAGFLKIGPTFYTVLRRLQDSPLKPILDNTISAALRWDIHKAIRQRTALPISVKEMLRPIIEPDIRKLETLLHRDLSDWDR